MKNFTTIEINKQFNNETASDIFTIYNILDNNRKITDRIELCRNKGYKVEVERMGSGGVYQVKELQNSIRVQISSGWGRYNYAHVVVLSK